MQKINYYLTSIYSNTMKDIEEIEKYIDFYCDLLLYLDDNKDKTIVPNDYYLQELISGILVCDYLFDAQFESDSRNLLFEIIMKSDKCEHSYSEIFEMFKSIRGNEYIALAGIFQNEYITEDRLYINDKKNWLIPHRFYLEHSETLALFMNDIKDCFPNLVFNNRVEETAKVFHDIKKHSPEIIRHLTVLNDSAKELYKENEDNPSEVYQRLSAQYDIICTGRGSKEGLEMFQCIFTNDNNEDEIVRCNPHTKLYNAYSDYRIYFHWGRSTIKGGNILVGHLGGHWKKEKSVS